MQFLHEESGIQCRVEDVDAISLAGCDANDKAPTRALTNKTYATAVPKGSALAAN